jgi:DNA-binding NarL/FixJ family response regulator
VVKPFTLEDIRVELELALFRHSTKKTQSFPDLAAINTKVKISEREYEIISDIKDGLKNDQIATKLFISENTVKSHIKRIYQKCEVHSKVELVSKLMNLQHEGL